MVPIARGSVRESLHLTDMQEPWRYASCDDADALDRALLGTSAVINCAGPFLDTAPALVEAALRGDIHYFDLTAEQRSVRQTLATYDREARERGVVILPAMAFYGGLADLLATLAVAAVPAVESIDVAVALDHWHPTAGTRNTGARNSARRLVIAGGRLVPLPNPAPTGHWQFPQPFGEQPVIAVPLSEIITISRHISAKQVRSYLNARPLEDLRNPETPAPIAADSSGRSAQRFVMEVVATSRAATARATASGQDIYAVSAPLVVEACGWILTHGPRSGGAFAPGEILNPAEFFSPLHSNLHVALTTVASSHSAQWRHSGI